MGKIAVLYKGVLCIMMLDHSVCCCLNVSALTDVWVWFLCGYSISTKVRKSTSTYNLDADQSVGFINVKRIKAVNYMQLHQHKLNVQHII